MPGAAAGRGRAAARAAPARPLRVGRRGAVRPAARSIRTADRSGSARDSPASIDEAADAPHASAGDWRRYRSHAPHALRRSRAVPPPPASRRSPRPRRQRPRPARSHPVRTILMLAALLLACNELRRRLRRPARGCQRDDARPRRAWTTSGASTPGCRGAAICGSASCASSASLENAGRGAGRTGHRELPQRRCRPCASVSGGRRRGTCSRRSSSSPGNTSLKASLRYCEGHLHRIDGEAEKLRRRTAAANQHFTEAVSAFREAAELRRDWPDPFLGLARTFIYGLEDIDRGGRRDAAGAEVRVLDRRSRDRAARRRLPGAWRHALADGAAALPTCRRKPSTCSARRRRTGRRSRSTSGSRASPASRVNLRRTRRALDQIEVRMSELESGKDEPAGSHPMAITYTTAAERDVRRAHASPAGASRALDLALAGASVLAVAADVRRLPGGRLRPRGRGDIAAPIVNLNTVADAADPRDRLRAGAADAGRSAAGRPGAVGVSRAGRRRARGPFPTSARSPAYVCRKPRSIAPPTRSRVSRSPARRARPRGGRGDRAPRLGVAADLRAACGDQAVLDRPGPRGGPAPAAHCGPRSISSPSTRCLRRGGGAGFAAIACCSRPPTC